MEVDKCPVDIPGIPQSAFMVEAHFFKATHGRDIPSLHHGIQPMQVIDGLCQGGKMCDHHGSQPLVPVVRVAHDNAYFAVFMGGINMFQRTVADEDLVSIHNQ